MNIIFSIYHRKTEQCVRVIWSKERVTWTTPRKATRWCDDCYQAAFDSLPMHFRINCMVVVNQLDDDGYEYECPGCEQEEAEEVLK